MRRLRSLGFILGPASLVLAALLPASSLVFAQTTPASGVRIQQNGTELGRATVVNCSTNVTCTLPVGTSVVEVEATGGGGGSPGGSSGDLQTNDGAGGFGGFAGDACSPGDFASAIGTDGTLTCATPAGGGTVTHTAGALTANRLVLGNGADDITVLGSLGTTTTVLHGNAAGAPSFGAVVSADMNITPTSCTNQFVTAISAGGVGTCTTASLTGAQFANQGTTTTVLHGNAAGNPSFGQIVNADITNGTIALTKFANQAGDTILSNMSGAPGPPIASTLGDILNAVYGVTQGVIIHRDASGWVTLPPGTSGQFLQTQGAGADIQWSTPSGSGDVSSNTSTSVVNEIALFADTSGKLIKRSTGTGVGRVDSGVLSAAELSGDVTTSGTNATTIANNAVTTGKILNANVTKAKIEDVAADKLLGRGNGGGAGAPQEITLGTNLSMSGTTLNASGGGSSAQTFVVLGSDLTSVNTTTGAEVTGLQAGSTGTGTFQFSYYIRWQNTAVGVGARYGVNHTGTVGFILYHTRVVGGSGAADQDLATGAGAVSSSAARAVATTAPPIVATSSDTVNLDMLVIVEGIISVTGDGDLELWHACEQAAGNLVTKAGSTLILTKVGS